MLRRYDYAYHPITNVALETAGTIDLDVEIKFTIGDVPLSIDIHKKFATDIKDLYKVLHAISIEGKENEKKFDIAQASLSYAAQSIGRISSQDVTPAESFEAITRFSTDWMIEQKDKYVRKDFSDLFDLYINK